MTETSGTCGRTTLGGLDASDEGEKPLAIDLGDYPREARKRIFRIAACDWRTEFRMATP